MDGARAASVRVWTLSGKYLSNAPSGALLRLAARGRVVAGLDQLGTLWLWDIVRGVVTRRIRAHGPMSLVGRGSDNGLVGNRQWAENPHG